MRSSTTLFLVKYLCQGIAPCKSSNKVRNRCLCCCANSTRRKSSEISCQFWEVPSCIILCAVKVCSIVGIGHPCLKSSAVSVHPSGNLALQSVCCSCSFGSALAGVRGSAWIPSNHFCSFHSLEEKVYVETPSCSSFP